MGDSERGTMRWLKVSVNMVSHSNEMFCAADIKAVIILPIAPSILMHLGSKVQTQVLIQHDSGNWLTICYLSTLNHCDKDLFFQLCFHETL